DGGEQNFYDDGATPYNFVNALNLWTKVDSGKSPKAKEWKDIEPIFVRRILESAWEPGKGFRHFTKQRDVTQDAGSLEARAKSPVAIYATRAAVDMLMGINFTWPTGRVTLSQADLGQIHESLENLRGELRQLGETVRIRLSETFGGGQIEGILRDAIRALL